MTPSAGTNQLIICQFWKEFFEKSANISLSSYEENADHDAAELSDTTNEHGDYGRGTPEYAELEEGDETITTNEEKDPPTAVTSLDQECNDTSILDSPSVKGRTPRPAIGKPRQITGSITGSGNPLPEKSWRGKQTKDDPETPGTSKRDPPLGRPSPFLRSGDISSQRRGQEEVLLHRALDKNYRLQATPHTARKAAGRVGGYQQLKAPANAAMHSSSPFSPDVAAPQLRADIFGPSPGKRAPPTPGVSVLHSDGRTPRRGHENDETRRTLFPSDGASKGKARQTDDWDSDSEFDYDMGLSPPKTMQFHVPQNRLMQTPAKEASRRIVEDLLLTAGVGGSVTDEMSELRIAEGHEEMWTRDFEAGLADSPSIVRPGRHDDDENTF